MDMNEKLNRLREQLKKSDHWEMADGVDVPFFNDGLIWVSFQYDEAMDEWTMLRHGVSTKKTVGELNTKTRFNSPQSVLDDLNSTWYAYALGRHKVSEINKRVRDLLRKDKK